MNTSSVKCIRDIRSIPPFAYRLETDGRQWKHLCQQRKALAMQLASYANGDGSSIKVAVETLASALGLKRRAVEYRLDDLDKLGFLENGKRSKFKGTRERTLNIAALTARASDVQSSTDTSAIYDTDVHSSDDRCAIYNATDVQSTPDANPETPEDCTQPSLEADRPKSQPTIPPSNPAGGAEEDSDDLLEAEIMKSYETWQFEWFMKNLPTPMQGAIFQKTQRAEIEKLVEKHSAECLLTIMHRWIELRELPIEGLRVNRWGAFLNEITPHIAPGKKLYEAKWREKRIQEWEQLRRSLRERGKLDKAFLESDWSLGQQDADTLNDFLKAKFDYDKHKSLYYNARDAMERYEYWLQDIAGTIKWTEEVEESFKDIAEQREALANPVTCD